MSISIEACSARFLSSCRIPVVDYGALTSSRSFWGHRLPLSPSLQASWRGPRVHSVPARQLPGARAFLQFHSLSKNVGQATSESPGTSTPLGWTAPHATGPRLKKRRDVSASASAASFAEDPAIGAAAATVESAWGVPKATFWDHVRAVAFYLTTLFIAIPLFLVMLLIQPLVLLLDSTRRRAQHAVNDLWANSSTSLYYHTEIVGAENLPETDAAAVYVANHQSQLDIYTLFKLQRPFKFISKTSNFLIPIIGWSMYLTGHVPLARADKRSQLECLKQCLGLLQKGVPVLFFPEGTRSKDGRMASFKKGAFSIAAKAGVPVVPIALLGTGTLMPNGAEGTLYSTEVLRSVFGGVDTVRVVVHPPLVGKDADELCRRAQEVIAETLVENGLGIA